VTKPGSLRLIATRVLPYVVTAVALLLVLRGTDWSKLGGLLATLNIWWFLAGMLGFAGTIAIQVYRWVLCLSGARMQQYWSLMWLHLSSLVFNNLGVGFLGGDLYRTVKIAREHGMARSAFSVFLARLTNMWGAAMLPAAFAPLVWSTIADNELVVMLVILSAITWPLSLIFVLAPRYRQTLALILEKRGFERGALGMRSEIFAGSNPLLLLLTSLAFQVASIGVTWFLALSLHLELSLWELGFVIPYAMLLTSLPISVNGLGIREVCFVVGFGLFGLSEVQALGLSALTYAGHILLTLVGVIVLLRTGRGASELPKAS
jgi:uncharacterized membrane protein YbhN (UPF0104 family)